MAVAVVANALRWEWYRLRRRTAFWVIMGLAAAGAAAQLAVQTLLARVEAFPAAAYHYPVWTMAVAGETMPLIAVALSAMAFGGDAGGGTMRALVARGLPRWQAGLGKLLLVGGALAALLAGIWMLSALVGLAAAAGVSAPSGGGAGAGGGWGAAAVGLARVGVVTLAYVGLGSALATAGRSTAFGAGVGIAIIIFESVAYPSAGAVVEAVWGFDSGDYTRWTLGGATSALARGSVGGGWAWTMAAVTGVYAVGLWGLTLGVLSRQDLSIGRG